ncbi:tight adherence protein C [Pseudidiomarina planktonica]|uniref:Tight adherence protein C n=1 Tax=Pseudidiomarina planktonica TaxID=1323738 RepID=A0A1Y6EN87_9GAMM|nr:type II secretion system F family protein [Pseudidiomarina planktonica]RUO65611.1 hypothetical protein CWI77_03940 [Pseudidiomarina planktonica]SMQ64118.1 tight adherence protein C [Pseudidiomarina planktonica]
MSLMLIATIWISALALCLGGIWFVHFIQKSFAYSLGVVIRKRMPAHWWHTLEPAFWNQSSGYQEVWFAQQVCLLVVAIGLLTLPKVAFASLLLLGILIWRVLMLRRSLYRARRSVVSELPAVLDLTAMLLQAGTSLSAALLRVADAPKMTPLTFELVRMRNRLRSGVSLEQAFQELSNRFPLPEIGAFVMTAVHSIRTGSVLSQVLIFQAQQRRQEALLRMEKRAQEAPVKLLFPLILCFFPVSFILLLGPVFLRFSME